MLSALIAIRDGSKCTVLRTVLRSGDRRQRSVLTEYGKRVVNLDQRDLDAEEMSSIVSVFVQPVQRLSVLDANRFCDPHDRRSVRFGSVRQQLTEMSVA